MNGKKQVLNKNMIKYGDEDEFENDGMTTEYGNSKSRLETLDADAPITTASTAAKDAIDNSIAEQPAYYPGGESSLISYINKHLVYPASARAKGIVGNVMLRFIIETDGSVGKIEIEKSLEDCDNAAMDVIKKIKFIPAKEAGKAISVWYRLPIRFKQ